MSSRNCNNCNNISIVEAIFGEVYADGSDDGGESTMVSSLGDGDNAPKCSIEPIQIKSYTMKNSNRMEVVLITWGASIVSIKVPDKWGDPEDVVLGFNDLGTYLDPVLNPFVGCILGRCANRIKDGTFRWKDKDYFLTRNDDNVHHIHGGTNGLGRRVWDALIQDNQVVMTYLSEDGEEGYPGALLTTVKFKLTNDNKLEIRMRATTSKPTVVNLSYGTLFNLAGHNAGECALKEHKVSLNCDRWTFSLYENPIPTGAIRGVGGTIMDFRIPQLLCDALSKVPPEEGFDHNWCVVRTSQPEMSFVGRALHADTGRFLEVFSDQPAVQFYTGGRLPPHPLPDEDCFCGPEEPCQQEEPAYECADVCDCESKSTETSESSGNSVRKVLEYLPGKCCAKYTKFAGFSMQPQNYPNACNIPHFPCSILRPGQVYYHDLVYKFGVQLSGYM